VQKGKFAAWALALATTALNSVDLPTFGRPTIPALNITTRKQVKVLIIDRTGQRIKPC
jgi:hypothetical protein